jgi:hypothetical protein
MWFWPASDMIKFVSGMQYRQYAISCNLKIELVWLRKGTGGELLWIRYWTFGFHEMLGNYQVSKYLGIPRVVLSSMGLVILVAFCRGGTSVHTYLHSRRITKSVISSFGLSSKICCYYRKEIFMKWDVERSTCCMVFVPTFWWSVRYLSNIKVKASTISRVGKSLVQDPMR